MREDTKERLASIIGLLIILTLIAYGFGLSFKEYLGVLGISLLISFILNNVAR